MKRGLLSVFFMLILFFMGSCSVSDNGETGLNVTQSNNDSNDLQFPTESAADKAETRYTPDLPESNFGGYEFRAVISTDNIYGPFTFCAVEETGDTIIDAIYRRNRFIEEKYNVVFKQTEMDLMSLEGIFKKSVMAASDDFDVCMQIDRYGYNLGVEGYVLPAENLPRMDLNQPWYAKDVNEASSVGGKHYIVFSDECINMYGLSVAVCFNKQLIQDLGFENPYELVKNGTWTYDKFYEMCKSASQDTNGDGLMTDTDRYGVLSQDNWISSNFWVCAGINTVIKDEEGVLRLNIVDNTKLLDMLEKAREVLFGDEKIYFSCYQDKVTSYTVKNEAYASTDISFQQFGNNQGLFYTTLINTIPMMRSLETDFGIIPFPKADLSQERYYTRNGGGFPLMVPAHIPNPERTSIIFEAIAAESKNTAIPAYKEINLKTKFTRDDESVEMLDIIFENVVMELGDVMFLGPISSPFVTEIRGKGNFASLIEKNSANFQKALDKINESAANLQ